jgi:hypothetical protein
VGGICNPDTIMLCPSLTSFAQDGLRCKEAFDSSATQEGFAIPTRHARYGVSGIGFRPVSRDMAVGILSVSNGQGHKFDSLVKRIIFGYPGYPPK